MRKVILCLIGVMLVSNVWGQEKQIFEQSTAVAQSTGTTKKELKLLWKKEFEYPIEHFSVSDNGSVMLITTRKIDRDITNVKRYLLDNTGKIIREEKNQGFYTKTGKMRWEEEEKRKSLGGILSNNGKYIMKKYGWWGDNECKLEVFDLSGNLLWEKNAAPADVEYEIFSPMGEYIAVIPGYEADFPFLKVYETRTGKLLWGIEERKEKERIFLTAAFCSDEKIAVYTEGKVALYDTKTGEKYWEKVLLSKGEYQEGDAASPPAKLATSKNADIIIIFNEHGYLPNQHKWTENSKIFSLNDKGVVRWKYENPEESGWVKMSNTGKFIMVGFAKKGYLLFDNNSGKILWEKNGPGVWGEFTLDDKYILAPVAIDKQEGKKGQIYRLIDVNSGDIFQTNMKIENDEYKAYKLLDTKLIFTDKDKTIYFFDIKNFFPEDNQK